MHMAKVLEHYKIDDDLSLFKQKNSPFWQARFKADKWYTKSTKSKELNQAIRKASELQSEAKTKLANGIPLKANTFEAIANKVLNDLQEECNATDKRNLKDYIRAINNYFLPYFGGLRLSEIDQNAVDGMAKWRASQWADGSRPSQSTLNTHNAALNRIFDYAVDNGQMSPLKRPKLSAKDGEKAEARGSYSEEEIQKIYEYLNKWPNETKNKRSREIRYLLKSYVFFALATGMRIGSEIDNLSWGDFIAVDHKAKDGSSAQCYDILVTKGKNAERKGRRKVRVRANKIDFILDDLRKRNRFTAKSDLVFVLPDGKSTKQLGPNFRRILNALNINGPESRTFYSLRHTYITKCIEKGVPTSWLAKHCGTSTEMLDKHYNHVVYVDDGEGHSSFYKEAKDGVLIDADDSSSFYHFRDGGQVPKKSAHELGDMIREMGLHKAKNKK